MEKKIIPKILKCPVQIYPFHISIAPQLGMTENKTKTNKYRLNAWCVESENHTTNYQFPEKFSMQQPKLKMQSQMH